MAFENRMFRRMFGSKRDEITKGCIKLHNVALKNLYSLPNITRIINQEGRDGQNMEEKNEKILKGTDHSKIPG
jgi:hypothetical protein